MDIQIVTTDMQSNLESIAKLEIEIKKVAPEVPDLPNYTEKDFVLYLAKQDVYEGDDDYDTFKNHLIDKYEKRQEFTTSREYYITLNLILENLIEFYQDNLRDPDDDELEELAEGTGIQQNIDKSISYIRENIL